MNTAKQVGQSAQDIAKSVAKQIVNEPIEILKESGNQITGSEIQSQQNIQTPQEAKQEIPQNRENEKKDKAFADRRMQALQAEVNDIRKQDVFGELQAKISEGIEIPLENYPELSMEQKQVLKAQMEAVKIQNSKFKIQNSMDVPAIHSKPSRRWGAGQKGEAEKQQTRVEKPIPPSG